MIWDDMMEYIRMPGVDSELCKSLSGTDAIYNDRTGWIVDQYSGDYPVDNFCKEECDNNKLGCDVGFNHDILIVGTDYYNGKHYWKLRNSWGTNWGHNGCFYVQRDIDSNGNTGRRNLLAINEFVYYVTVKTDPN